MKLMSSLLMAAVLTAPASTAQMGRTTNPNRRTTVLFDDQELNQRTRNSIADWPPLAHYLRDNAIRITTHTGCITLDGTVSSEADRKNIGVRANAVRGAFWVENKLRVAPPRVKR